MTMPFRPLKKARLETFVSAQSHEDTTRNFHLCPLFQRFASVESSFANDEEFESILRETISVLEASKTIDWSSARKLHGMLLLNMGFLLPSKAEDIRLGPICMVTTCLLSLYQCKNIERYHEKYAESIICTGLLEPEEAKEAYSLVLQVMGGLNVSSVPISKNLSRSLDNCLRLVQLFLLQNAKLRQSLDRNRHRLESLLYSILIVSSEQLRDQIRQSKQDNKERLLSIIQNISCTTARLAKIAKLASSGSGDQDEIRLYCTSHEDLVFYLKCLSHGVSSRLCLKKADFARLLVIAQDKSISGGDLKVIECLCQMIERWGIGDSCHQMLDTVTELILHKAHVDEASVHVPIRCIEMLTRRAEVCETLMKLKGFNKLLEFLIAVAVSQSQGKELAVKAADTLLTVAFSASQFTEDDEEVKQKLFQPVEVVSYLVVAETQQVVEKAVKFLGKMFRNERQRQKSNFDYPNLIYVLAQASSNEYSSQDTKHQVIAIFRIVADMDTKLVNFLARETKVLESIVRAASDHGTENSREVAISIILTISKNACNHRILARHPGLLSSLIGHTRGMPGSRGGDTQVRESMKKQILSLAKAL
jgi:hypothetical protein